MKKYIFLFFILASVSLEAATPTPTFTTTPWYSFKGETFSTGDLLTSTAVSDTTEGYWTAHAYNEPAETVIADIQTAPWSSNAIRISGSNASQRSAVGNTRTTFYRANGVSLTVRGGSVAGAADRHAPWLMWDGVYSFDSHPYNGYVFQYRSASNEARITRWINGINQLIIMVSHAVADEEDFEMVCYAGPTGALQLYLDGSLVINTVDSKIFDGSIGLMIFGTTDTFFDDLEVRTLGTNISPTVTPTNTPLPCPPFIYCEDFESYNIGDPLTVADFTLDSGSQTVEGASFGSGKAGEQSAAASWATAYLGDIDETDGKFTSGMTKGRTYICSRVSTSASVNFQAGYCLEVSPADTRWRLMKANPGSGMSITLDSNTSFTPNDSNEYSMAIRCEGTNIKGFVDGVEVSSVTDSSFTSGFPGIMSFGGDTQFDDLTFDNFTTPTPEPSGSVSPYKMPFTDKFRNNFPFDLIK